MGARGTVWTSLQDYTNRDLIKKGHLSKLDIRVLLLKHPPRTFETYEDEIQYIISHEQRTNFIKNGAQV